MDIDNLRDEIKKRRSNGETYESIGDDFGTSGSMIQYIEEHPRYNPGRNIKKKLGLETSDKYTRTRRDRLNDIAIFNGYKSWCAFETYVLNRPWVSEAADNLSKLRERKEEKDADHNP